MTVKAILLMAVVGFATVSSSAHAPVAVETKKIVIECIDTDEGGMNWLNNQEATSRKWGGDIYLYQYQVCKET